MKKLILKSVVAIGLVSLLTGCVEIPAVPDFAKVSTYQGNSSNSSTTIALTENQKLSCEYRYCQANSILETDSNCTPAKNYLEKQLKPYRNDFDMTRRMKIIDNFVKQCPHSNITTYPF